MTATSYLTESAEIWSHLIDNWATTGIAFPWADFDPDGAAHIVPRLTRQDAFNVTYSASSKRVRHPGLLLIDVKTPLKDSNGNPLGYGTAETYADTLCGLFRNATIGGVVFRAPTARPLGPSGHWYVVQVSCPYWRDSIHAN